MAKARNLWKTLCIPMLPAILTLAAAVSLTAADLGIFTTGSDVGPASKPGTVVLKDGAYTVSASGSNMWFNADAFHLVWKKVSGDISLAATVEIPPSPGGDPHRKAVLIVRQSLDPDSAYADAALHGDGLTSLQYRETKGARTYEVQANASKPRRLQIEKRGKYVSMSLAGENGELVPAGGSFRLILEEPFYVGIGVCAHNKDRFETAIFSKVELKTGADKAATNLWSTLETVPIASKDRRAIFTTKGRIEAPNWMHDGSNLVFNAQGKIQRISVTGGSPTTIDTGFATRCNNDHGISPDGATLVISDQTQGDRKSRIYTLPISGGEPKPITKNAPSYWHGWSPDGKTLAFCGERGGEFDIYTIPSAGGVETRLTTAKGLDDGPDYTADGQWIYFNSDRTGQMQVWRMKPDGSQQEQVTSDEFNNWFPHPSPDGKWLVFLSYEKDVKGHPEDKDVTLRIMPLGGGKIETLAKLFGGQGTINVPSWSPDSKRVSFVSYQRR
jgi:TolB protein